MQFYAYHGYFPEEQLVGAQYELTLALDLDISKPGKTDELKDTLNYQQVYDVVKSEMAVKSHLIEHVAQRIIDSLFANFSQILQIELNFSKLNPPLGGQVNRVSVIISELRTEN